MLIQEIPFMLKDGRAAVLRSPRDGDIPDMIDYLYRSAGETEFVLRYPEECGQYTPEVEKAVFERVNTSDHEAMLVCFVEGKVAGVCSIVWSTRLKLRHRASVAIGNLRDYWDLGIGTKMFSELIHIAEENETLLQIELDFIEGNVRARALYEKFGFRITGVKPDAIRLKDGTFRNEDSMVRKIDRSGEKEGAR